MNILYANWNCFCADDAVDALQELGHNLYVIQISDRSHEAIDADFIEILDKQIDNYNADLIFSFNYFPTLSEACQNKNIKYWSFIYDNPSVKVSSPTIRNSCNFVFTFDHAMYDELRAQSVETIYYAPLPVNMKRLNALTITATDRERYSCDIAFVGSLYNEKHHLYERMESKTKDRHLIGYLEGVMEAQMKVYGYNFIKECLTPEILDAMFCAMPYEIETGSLSTIADVYSDYFICRRLAHIERTRILEMLSAYYKVYHYTNDSSARAGKSHNMGKVDYYTEMPNAFRCAKINLNMTLRSIKTGIPLRAMDILGAGGFLMTNYQEDLLYHFEPDRDFVYYSSIEELKAKSSYFLRNDQERKKIAENGRIRMEQDHTFIKRLNEMLTIITK